MKITNQQRSEARDQLYELIDDNLIDIPMAIKLIRKIYGLGQDEFGKKVGVSKKTVTNIETNSGNPTINNINKLLSPMKLQLKVRRKD